MFRRPFIPSDEIACLAPPAATVHDLYDIREFLEKAVMQLGGNEDLAGDLVLSVNEAVTNVLLHGYSDQPGLIELSVEANGSDLTIRLSDGGPLFDPTTAPTPDLRLPLDQRPLGGLGVHMMRQLTDELAYSVTGDQRNELKFIRRNVLGKPTR